MDIEALFKHKAFSKLSAEQMRLFRQFAKDIPGKSTMEISRLYMQLNQKVSQVNPLSAEQRKDIIEAVKSFIPEGDRYKLSGFLKMLGR